jgi:hypothetical protein
LDDGHDGFANVLAEQSELFDKMPLKTTGRFLAVVSEETIPLNAITSTARPESTRSGNVCANDVKIRKPLIIISMVLAECKSANAGTFIGTLLPIWA